MRFRPRSLSDTLDGDNVAAGACSALTNLIKDPATPMCLQCRPAAIPLSVFAGFSTPGVVSAAYQVNNLVYGLIGSARNTGNDEPFCYNLTTATFVTVSGITAANTPATQATTGDWTPPSMEMVGTRVIVTHPGFPGGTSAYFGYFDVSGYTETTTGNITAGSPTITGNIPITGLGPGYTVSGTGIPTNSTVLNTTQVTPQSTGNIHSNTTLDSVANIAGFAPGQPIVGLGIPSGTTIASISGTTITLSQAATATTTGITISATGTVITISANATATTVGLSITLAGGTTAAPLWAAGNTTNIPLIAVPQQIAQFNNRPYFAVKQYLVFCDALTLNISSATNALTVGDTSPITCLQPLTIINAATAAPVSGLLAFKENLINLINGDPTTSNLTNSNLSASGIGTTSPNAVSATQVGVFFPATDGIRCVELSGTISDPLPDLQVPIQNALYRTRMSSAYNNGVYRICLQNGAVASTPWQEFWFDLKSKMWTGPHTFQQDLAVGWNATFICFSHLYPAKMYQADVVQGATASFVENGAALSWNYTTSTTGAGDEDITMNSLVLSTINVAFKAGNPQIQCVAADQNGTIVGQAILSPPAVAAIWGAFTWGNGTLWYGAQYGLQPRVIPWTSPVVFSKFVLGISGQSALGFSISNFQALYQPLGYPSTAIAGVSTT
jgi:hypothetical protein